MFKRPPAVQAVSIDEIYHWVLESCDQDTDAATIRTRFPDDANFKIAQAIQLFLFSDYLAKLKAEYFRLRKSELILTELELKDLVRQNVVGSTLHGIEAISYIEAKRRRAGRPGGKLFVSGSSSGSGSGSGMCIVEDPLERMVNIIDNYCNNYDDINKHYHNEKERQQARLMFAALKSMAQEHTFFVHYRNGDLRTRHAVAKQHAIKPFANAAEIEAFIATNAEPMPSVPTPSPRGSAVRSFLPRSGSFGSFGSLREMPIAASAADTTTVAVQLGEDELEAEAAPSVLAPAPLPPG